MHVELIGLTAHVGEGLGNPERLIEFAGRLCYRSPSKGREAGGRFIQKRVQQGHESIIEHASASFLVEGISRTCSHQLVRHRLASVSQESQRYVDMGGLAAGDWVIPPDVDEDDGTLEMFRQAVQIAQSYYGRLMDKGVLKEDARFLLPNAAPTRLVFTANFRELLHVFRVRISPHAQWEIREVARVMLDLVTPYAPNVFGALRDQLQEKYPAFWGAWVIGPEADRGDPHTLITEDTTPIPLAQEDTT